MEVFIQTMKNLFRLNRYQLNTDSSLTLRSGHKYVILFISQGACQIQPGGQACIAPDMLLLKPGQVVSLATYKSFCSLLSVSIPASSLTELSDSTCDLGQKFQFAPYGISVVHAEIKSSMLMQNLLARLESLAEEETELGTKLYEKSLFTAFLIIFLRTCVQSDQVYQLHQKKMLIIDDVFAYISQHLTEDLSLEKLEKKFFVSKEHLSREFKKSTGITLHSYITRSRVDLSKKYLLQGLPVRDVCQLCGFGSYNHFFKAFKKECGITPMAFYRKERRQNQ